MYKRQDLGLLKPDLTFFFACNDNSQRQGFGDERYESSQFQLKVRDQFAALFKHFQGQDYICILDTTDKSIDQVHDQVWAKTLEFMRENADVDDFTYF